MVLYHKNNIKKLIQVSMMETFNVVLGFD